MKCENLAGQTFGRLTVVEQSGFTKDRKLKWLCECSCGNMHVAVGKDLKSGHTKSCGCYRKEFPNRKTHGGSKDKLYYVWKSMRERTQRKKCKDYPYYGGRGISVCDEWSDYAKFKEWALNSGYKEGLEIDRENNNGDYCPDNCRWSTRKEQNNNTRANRIITYNGESHTVAQWAEIKNISYSALQHRLDRNWDVEKILTTPMRTAK